METFCTSGPNSKYRTALTSSSFYQATPYSRNVRQSDYSLAGRGHHSTLQLWHQKSKGENFKPRNKICSIALAAAAFLVVVIVLSIAGLALYMGVLRNDVPTQLLTFSCSAKILRGDRFLSNLQEKALKYKQQLENVYHKSAIGSGIVSVMVDRFGEDGVTIYFTVALNGKKLSKNSNNLEKLLKDILLNDSLSKQPIFRHVRFDPRSLQIRRVLDSDGSLQRVRSKPKEAVNSRSGVLLRSNNKYNVTNTTTHLPVRKKQTIDELDSKEDKSVIQGSFHISKTEADITEKKSGANDNLTHRPKITPKSRATLKTTSTNSPITNATYKIGLVSNEVARFTTAKSIIYQVSKTSSITLPLQSSKSNSSLTTLEITYATSPTTKISSASTKSSSSTLKITTTSESLSSPSRTFQTTSKSSSTSQFPINPFLFAISPHSLNKEPWVPIKREPSNQNGDIYQSSLHYEVKPTISIIERLQQRQPVYTSFTNPGLLYHFTNMEKLGSTNIVGHPLPVNKIADITEPTAGDRPVTVRNLEKITELSKLNPQSYVNKLVTVTETNKINHSESFNKISNITELLITTTQSSKLFSEETAFELIDINGEPSSIEGREAEDITEIIDRSKPEDQSAIFVEVETLKHIPGSVEHNFEELSNSPNRLKWQFLNGTGFKPTLQNQTDLIFDRLYNNTLRAVLVKDHILNMALNQNNGLKNPSEMFELETTAVAPVLLSTTANSVIITTDNYQYNTVEPNVSKHFVEENASGQGQVEVVDVDEESLILETETSTKLPLVTLIPVKSNSGVGRPLRRRPKIPENNTDIVENRSFPSDPFYKNVNVAFSELSKSSVKYYQTEVVTSVSSEINKVKINKNHINDIKIAGELEFVPDNRGTSTTKSSLNHFDASAELIRNPKMDPNENITTKTTYDARLKDEVSVVSFNSSTSNNQKDIIEFGILTQDKLRQLSAISKLNMNSSEEKEAVISNKAISPNYVVNQAGFKILTKTFNKISTFSKDDEKSNLLGFNSISLQTTSNKSECNNYNVKCGDGQCLPDSTRCNLLVECNDGEDEKNCNCADYLRSQYLLRKICDGVVDCWDFSDENLCEWCNPNQHVCANSKFCIDNNKICDGIRDCPNGDDERQCVTVAPTITAAQQFSYYSEGYLMVRKHGRWGKLCMENFQQVIEKIKPPWQLTDLGRIVCKSMTYQKLNTINTITEAKFEPYLELNNSKYYVLSYTNQNMTKSNLLFKDSNCESGEVVRMKCGALECGARPRAINHSARIVGGGNAGLGAWPWQGALYKEGEFQCGATLISDDWLLSAGHCFFHSLEEYWVARLGTLRRGTALPSPYEQLRAIIKIIIHPGYVDSGFINDISLLKMENPITFSDYVRPICLPQPGISLKDGRICTVIGWGQLFEVGRIFPDTLQEVQVPVISTSECLKHTLFLPLYKVTDDMFCAGYERGGRDACLGDSGGPLMCSEPDGHWVLQGITSNGYGCARANRPGVYTKVSNYANWIHSHIYNSTIKDDAPTIKTTCLGHRCPLGECLSKSRLCNGYIECSDGSDEKNCSNI